MKNVLTCLCICVSQFLAAQIPFEKIYPTTSDRALRDLCKMPDGGYMLCGWTNVSDPSECDAFVMRTDVNGEVLPGWPKTFGKNGPAKVDFAYSMTETTDGNYFILGYSASYGGGDIDIYLLKIKPDGSEIFTKTYGGTSFDEGREIIKTSDGNYVIVGSTTSGSNQQAFLMKIDNAGNPLWSPAMQTFGGSNKEFGNAVAENADGTLILTGQTMANDPRGDMYLVKTSSNGTMVWEQTYGEALADEGTDLLVNSDGSSVVIIRDSTAATDINVRIRKFDSQGSPGAFNKSFGGISKDTPKCITFAKDGNYYVGATSRSWNWRGNSSPDSPDMWLLKVNSATGDTIWSRNFGGPDHDHCERVRTDPVFDAILLCGHQVAQPYVKKPYFLRISKDGRVEALGLMQLSMGGNSRSYYDPSQHALHLEAAGMIRTARWQVCDISGRSLVSGTTDKQETKSLEIRLPALPAGVYVFSLQDADMAARGKFVVEAE